MKASNLIAAALLVGCSSFAMADVTIKIPDNVDLLSVNAGDPTTDSSGFFSSGETATLPDGVNQIVFKYEPFFDVNRDERKVISSKAIIARFEATDAELTLNVPTYRDARQAQKNIDNLEWSLTDKNGQVVPVVEDKLIKDGMQIGRDYNREADDYNRKGGVAALAVATTATVAPAAVATTTAAATTAAQPTTLPATAPAAGDNTAEEMLMFWYNKADADTKARFKEYVNKN
ncbi:DUF2057 family protein [Vibrio sp. 10N]|uniref:DUF2057 family protein n=1 Tax=Vibrio sp. 10N TaxID=3058938 RepID=UPI002812EF3C|nr:DUF2057 domain-containing protein [Vibrio sp. 10N]